MLERLLLSLIAVTPLALISVRFRAVDRTGALASWLVGVTVFTFGGWKWFVILLVFHATASLFTKYKYSLKSRLGSAEAKGGARTWKNVLANGSVAALCSALEGLYMFDLLTAGFLGAVGTAFADTIATEVGLLYRGLPRLITNFKKVPPGTSGAISPLGEAAMLMPITILTVLTYSLRVIEVGFLNIFILIATSSFLGSTVDSILGATVQVKYRCAVCGKVIESETHCGTMSKSISGVSFFDNHLVNFTSTLFGALIASVLYIALLR